MAKLAQARTSRGIVSAERIVLAWARAKPLAAETAAPAALAVLALFLRVCRLELLAWMPDTYEQLAAVQRLTRLEFPLSHIYPPGVALTLAPALLFLPATLASMQAVTITASLALVVVCYAGTKHATGDRVVATLAAAEVATAPLFVYLSRDGLFDVINAMWITLAFMLVPAIRGRAFGALALYGALLAVAVDVRATNVAFLPALLIWWTGAGRPGVRVRDAARAVLCRETITAGAVLAVLFMVLAYIGGWMGHAVGAAPVTFNAFAVHMILYVVSEFGGLYAFPVLVPLAALGAVEVRRRDRALLYAVIYMIVVWPVAHSPLPFANARYMLPSYVFTLLLVAHAPAAIAHHTTDWRRRARGQARIASVVAMSLVAIYFGLSDAIILRDWPATVAGGDEAAMRELRPIVAALPEGSLFVSPATRGVRESNPHIEYFDLIDYSLPRGNSPASVDAVLADIEREQAKGRRVYYLHSRVEATGDTFAKSGPGYESYFEGIERRFAVSPVYVASAPHYALYEVLPQSRGTTPGPVPGG